MTRMKTTVPVRILTPDDQVAIAEQDAIWAEEKFPEGHPWRLGTVRLLESLRAERAAGTLADIEDEIPF